MNSKKFKVIDIFSGAGGFSKGFEQAGFSIVDFAENNKYAIETYIKNINVERDIDFNNILNNSIDMFDESSVNKFIKRNKNINVDVLIGGFPCQGYSLIGKRDKDDKRNTLYKPTLKIIKELNPKIFVLENVPGILSLNNGNDVIEIKKILEKEGWIMKYDILDSSNFSVPQIRKRIFFIGTKDKKIDIDLIWKNLKLRNDNKIPISKYLLNNNENLLNNEKTNHRISTINKIKKLKEGEPLYKNFPGGTRRLFLDKPSFTIRHNNGGTFIHPIENRYMTAREIALLQTFPNDFIFYGPKTSQLKQIGNAVPVDLSKEIGKIIMIQLFKI